jgi:1-phosphofructokinase family hexose kinase
MVGRIITVGLAPAWDVCCRGAGLEWGRHGRIDSHVVRPAGKALNVSVALAWMGRPSVAAGLWGSDDYREMRRALAEHSDLMRVAMTKADGRTRQNVMVVDTSRRREMHLRCKSELATVTSLRKLKADLTKLVRKGDICVFSGAMPDGELAGPAIRAVAACRNLGARIVIDTSGPAMQWLLEEQLPWLIAPNVEELEELLGTPLKDTPAGLIRAARPLLERVQAVLISRGAKGAILLTDQGIWSGRVKERAKVLQTVGCGDYLLAGFLVGLNGSARFPSALRTGLKAATAHAWGWTGYTGWASARRKVKVEIVRF